jgi:hypothetical protein
MKFKIFNQSIWHRVRKYIVISLVIPLCALGMESASYKIEKDSLNLGGTDDGASASYNLKDTAGETGTGGSYSVNYKINAGYRAMEEDFLTFAIRNADEDADVNICALGTLSIASISTCQYRIKVGTSATAGFQIGIWADNKLNQSIPTIDINDVTEDSAVAAGIESYGIAVIPPIDAGANGTATLWTKQDPFDDDDTPIPVGEANMDVIFASNGTQDVDMLGTGDTDGTILVIHKAAISTATQAGNYNQMVTFIVSSIL